LLHFLRLHSSLHPTLPSPHPLLASPARSPLHTFSDFDLDVSFEGLSINFPKIRFKELTTRGNEEKFQKKKRKKLKNKIQNFFN
jgi:hypothetical protein